MVCRCRDGERGREGGERDEESLVGEEGKLTRVEMVLLPF